MSIFYCWENVLFKKKKNGDVTSIPVFIYMFKFTHGKNCELKPSLWFLW